MPRLDHWLAGEPPIDEMLNDPIVRLVMRRDGLGPSDVRAAIARARASWHGAANAARDVA